MAAMSDYLENKLIDSIFRAQAYTPPTTLYVAAVTVAENDAAGGTEVTGGSYARVAVAASLANWAGTQAAGSTVASTGSSGTTSNNVTIGFPQATANWGSVVGIGIFDASTGGNMLAFGALTTPQTVNSGNTLSFAPAALTFQIDN